MKLSKILEMADRDYPDAATHEYWELDEDAEGERDAYYAPSRNSGDTLEEFVVAEIVETFEEGNPSEEQLAKAVRIVTRAKRTLQRFWLVSRT